MQIIQADESLHSLDVVEACVIVTDDDEDDNARLAADVRAGTEEAAAGASSRLSAMSVSPLILFSCDEFVPLIIFFF
jgi:hypothetical protein